MDYRGLIARAMEVKQSAYAPYSHFRVGAALLTKNGKIFTGCNVENVSYSATNCAERTAVYKAISEGEREFAAIAVNGDNDDYLPPCGVCRQVLAEFCDMETFEVILANNEEDYQIVTLDRLLPGAFSVDNLKSGDAF
ncbi:MAG: cytidine deaminase [Lachnospiraceae bacterium]|jgi:cytidine deaminase|nr:cytidine deaminase [Lachnospiraceae bacterium]